MFLQSNFQTQGMVNLRWVSELHDTSPWIIIIAVCFRLEHLLYDSLLSYVDLSGIYAGNENLKYFKN